MEERRVLIRRELDRQLVQQSAQASEAIAKDQSKHRKRALRRAIRHTCKAVLDIEFSYKSGDSDEWVTNRQKIKGRVLDLSKEGAAFFIRHSATTNQHFNFHIDLFDGSNITGQAEVRWVKKQDSAKGYSVGVKFTTIDTMNLSRIENFLAELDATLGTAATLEDED